MGNFLQFLGYISYHLSSCLPYGGFKERFHVLVFWEISGREYHGFLLSCPLKPSPFFPSLFASNPFFQTSHKRKWSRQNSVPQTSIFSSLTWGLFAKFPLVQLIYLIFSLNSLTFSFNLTKKLFHTLKHFRSKNIFKVGLSQQQVTIKIKAKQCYY